MPVNNTNAITRYGHASAAAGASYSPQDTGIFVRAIPTGGTVLTLPADPGEGDQYGFSNVDGSCGPSSPLTLRPDPGGDATIGGSSVLVFATPFACGQVVFDSQENTWAVVSLGFGAPSTGPALANPTGIDPHDVSGQASDTGPGTPSQPLRTVAELNRRLRGARLSGILVVEQLSGWISPDEALVLTETSSDGTALIQWTGTYTVVHTGTLTSGTVPFDADTNATQILEDTAVPDFTVYDGLILHVTSGESAECDCLITLPDGHTAVGEPTTSAVPHSGDAYEIRLPSTLAIKDLRAAGIGIPVEFTSIAGVPPVDDSQPVLAELTTSADCTWAFPVQMPSGGAFVASGSALGVGGISPWKHTQPGLLSLVGCLVNNGGPSGEAGFGGSIILRGASMVTLQTLNMGPDPTAGQIAGSVVIEDAGVQFVGVDAELLVQAGPAQLEIAGQLLGNLNAATIGFFIVTKAIMPSGVPLPTITGCDTDFAVGSVLGQARAWDPSTAAYTTDPIACTWANTAVFAPDGFADPGGQGFGALDPLTDSAFTSGLSVST